MRAASLRPTLLQKAFRFFRAFDDEQFLGLIDRQHHRGRRRAGVRARPARLCQLRKFAEHLTKAAALRDAMAAFNGPGVRVERDL